MGKRYLIDTNTIIDYTSGLLPETGMCLLDEIINNEINISVISKIEALAFSPQNEAQKKYFDLVIDFVKCANIYNLDDDIIDKTIEIRKQYKLKLPDSIICATALLNNLTLITRNSKDFQRIPELNLIDPYMDCK